MERPLIGRAVVSWFVILSCVLRPVFCVLIIPIKNPRARTGTSATKAGSESIPVPVRLAGSERYVELDPFFHPLDLPDKVLEVLRSPDKVYLSGVDDQEWGFIITEKEPVVTLVDRLDVIPAYLSLVAPASHTYALLKYLRW